MWHVGIEIRKDADMVVDADVDSDVDTDTDEGVHL
jgi:hypothetical protein